MFFQQLYKLHTKVAFIDRKVLSQIFYIPLSKWFVIIESSLSVKMPFTDIDYF